MKKILLVVLALALVLAFAACGAPEESGGRMSDDTVIATVNGDPIYFGEYQSYLDNQYVSNFSSNYAALFSGYGIDLLDEESASDFLGQMENFCWNILLEGVLIRQLAAEYEVTLDEEGTGWLGDFISPEAYSILLNNMLYSDLYPLLKEELEAQANATDEDAQAVYDADPAAWDSRSSSHILVTCDTSDEASKAEAYEVAAEIIAKLNEGAVFEEVSAEYETASSSNFDFINAAGALLDGSSSMIKEYTDGLFSLAAVGDHTQEPILSQYGYHIIRLDGIKSSYADVAEMIKAKLNTVTDDDVKAYVTELMEARSNEAVIEMKEDFYLYYTEEPEGPADQGDTPAEGETEGQSEGESEPAAE